jgi:pectate lyase
MQTLRTGLLTAVVLLAAGSALAQTRRPDWRGYASKPDDWYRSGEGARVAANVLSNQSDLGDWPKNGNTTAEPYKGDRSKIKGTFDNGATVEETRLLARAFRATGKAEYKDAVLKSVDHILQAQYPTGGWPQTSPPGTGYPRYITYNDGTMVNLMNLLREVATSDLFAFAGNDRRALAQKEFDAGVACFLKSQVVVDGKKTVWCAQCDEVTLEPRPARSYELVSLSGSESAGILTLLMSLEKPSPEVIEAVDSGARWFDSVRLTGIRETRVNGDKVIVADTDAPPLWARFYEIGTNRPFFSGRDGVKKYDISQIEAERRNGYAWYGNWGTGLLERHARWKERLARAGTNG